MAIEKLKFLVTADTKNFALGMKAVGALAVAAFAAAIKVSAEFEKQLSKLEAVSGANVIQMGELETQARKLGKSTAFTAVEVAGLQVELAKLGFTSKQILQSSGGILDLAAGLGVELSEAAKLTGTSIRAFGLAAEDTGRVVDVLAYAAASSALDFTTLTEGLKDAAPIAKLYNFTIEDTVALLGQLSNAGIKGSKAGIALRQIFLELDKKGIAFADALNQVNESANPAATAMDLVGKRAAGAFSIIAQNQGAVNGLANELYNANGAANKMRLTMEDNLIGDFDKLKSAVTEMGLQLGETTDGPLRDFIQWTTDFINGTPDTLGAVDSISRGFLFLEESILLAFKAAEEFWQFQQRNNPAGWVDQLFGGDGMLQGSVDRMNLIKARLAEINAEIIKISDYGSGGSSSGTSGGSSSRTSGGGASSPTKTNNTIGAGSGDGTTDYGFGFAAFFDPGTFDAALENVKGFVTKAESEFTKLTASAKAAGTDIGNEMGQALQSALHGALVGLGNAIGDAIVGDGDFGDKFLKIVGAFMQAFGAAVIGIGVTALILESALFSGQPWLAIGAGVALVAAGAVLAGISSQGVDGQGGGSPSPVTSTTTTPTSTQGNGAGGQLVATVRGQELRFLLQGANDSYGALS